MYLVAFASFAYQHAKRYREPRPKPKMPPTHVVAPDISRTLFEIYRRKLQLINAKFTLWETTYAPFC